MEQLQALLNNPDSSMYVIAAIGLAIVVGYFLISRLIGYLVVLIAILLVVFMIAVFTDPSLREQFMRNVTILSDKISEVVDNAPTSLGGIDNSPVSEEVIEK